MCGHSSSPATVSGRGTGNKFDAPAPIVHFTAANYEHRPQKHFHMHISLTAVYQSTKKNTHTHTLASTSSKSWPAAGFDPILFSPCLSFLAITQEECRISSFLKSPVHETFVDSHKSKRNVVFAHREQTPQLMSQPWNLISGPSCWHLTSIEQSLKLVV